MIWEQQVAVELIKLISVLEVSIATPQLQKIFEPLKPANSQYLEAAHLIKNAPLLSTVTAAQDAQTSKTPTLHALKTSNAKASV